MLDECADVGKSYFREAGARIEMKYNGQRVDGTHAVNGKIFLENREGYFACSFDRSGRRMVEFSADGDKQNNFLRDRGASSGHSENSGYFRVTGVPLDDVLNVRSGPSTRNESFWEHQGEASIVWGYGSPEMRCSQRPSAAQIDSGAEAADPMPSLAYLPVVDMELFDPVKYQAASELAARGSALLDITLKIVGVFEGATQHIIQINADSEAPSASRLTVLRDGLMDDSIRGARWDITLEKTTAGVWSIKTVKRAWRCWRGGQVNRFATVPCP